MQGAVIIYPRRTAIYSFTEKGTALALGLGAALTQAAARGCGNGQAGSLSAKAFSRTPGGRCPQALGEAGAPLPQRQVSLYVLQKFLNPSLPSELKGQVKGFSNLGQLLSVTFNEFDEHIFFAACGLVVRSLAPHLKSKALDPAVVVVDQKGSYAISLLSGHMGGANRLAGEVAEILGGQAVLTTATDVEKLPAPDEYFARFGFKVVNERAIKWVNAALLATGKLNIFEKCQADGPRFLPRLAKEKLFQGHYNNIGLQGGEPGLQAALRQGASLPAGPGVLVSFKKEPAYLKKLVLAPPALHVGVGCRRGTSAASIIAFIKQVFNEHGLEVKALASLASIDQKRDEAGLLEAGRFFRVPCVFFSAADLQLRPGPSFSPKASAVFGVNGVCEPAALLSAELAHELLAQNIWGKKFETSTAKATLLLGKQTTENITLAVALPLNFCR